MNIAEAVEEARLTLTPEAFHTLIGQLQRLNRERNEAVSRHNHYAIGMESMASHQCEKGAAWQFVPGDPAGHFECIQCGVRA